ncbi:MAG: hypothetical protein HN919_05860 [Verrucomicrobia bacterium]|nr:hypothetical protein [Verrucomicrobiota bacterium]
MKYVAPDGSEHMRDEERQWLDIVSDPDPVKGMLLVFIQKLCSAFHELAPALDSGALGEVNLEYLSGRLGARADAVIERLRLNGLASIDGAEALVDLRSRLSTTTTSAEIIQMSEEVHLINHRLCDTLQQK